ncbi:MAG: chorismate mutase [Gallionellales bacterium GWA2_60_18]|nr:MAG: chorismate mutase [Gallionellales bacterium GWA2_60_18]
MSEQLKQFRAQIDSLDDELLKLVNRRAALAQQIGLLKEDGTVLRPEREAQILRRLQADNQGPLGDAAVAQLFTEVMSQCRALEAPLRVAYLGPHGTFSEAAVLQRFGQACEGLPADSIDGVFAAVESGAANYGMVPVENSTEGAIGRTLDLLLNSKLNICGEVLLQVHQCVLSNENDLSLIRKVYSHPQSFGQCQGWLNAHLPHADRITASSNADAARLAAEESFAAAVAGAQAAAHFHLKVLAQNIEDDARNTTRFLVLGNQQVAPSGNDKTSLVLSAPNRPGAVHDLLVPLARHGVSMTRLESRPARSGLWEYVFYIDIEGHQEDEKVAAALVELKQVAAFVKVLGSYPVAV